MKGLLLKDYYMMKKYMKMNLFMLLLLAAWIFSPDNVVLLMIPYLVFLQIPISLMSYEERSGWNVYGLTMPFARDRMVSEKFMLSLGIQVCAFLLICACALIGIAGTKSIEPASFGKLILLTASVGLVYSSVSLCIVFALGAEKGRLTYIVALILIMTFAFIGLITEGLIFFSACLCIALLVGVKKGNVKLPTAVIMLVAFVLLSLGTVFAVTHGLGEYLPFILLPASAVVFGILWKATRSLYAVKEV